MATFYTIDSANARVPEVAELLGLLRSQRADLIRLRDRLVELGVGDRSSMDDADGGRSTPRDVATERPAAPAAVDRVEEARLIHLRIQGVVDQMQASVARLDSWSITLRDIDTGLIDFPALAGGRQIWLCWRLGEGPIDWWHGVDDGFAGRRRIADLV